MFGLWTERNLRKNWGTGTSTGLKPTGFSSSGIPQHIVKRQLHFPDPRCSMVFHGVPQTKTEFGAFFHKLSQESRLLAPQSRGRLKRAALSSNCKYSSQNLHRVAKKKQLRIQRIQLSRIIPSNHSVRSSAKVQENRAVQVGPTLYCQLNSSSSSYQALVLGP